MKVATVSKPFSYDNLLLEINAYMRLVPRSLLSAAARRLGELIIRQGAENIMRNLGNLDYNAVVVSRPFLSKVTDSKLTLARAGIQNKGAHTESCCAI